MYRRLQYLMDICDIFRSFDVTFSDRFSSGSIRNYSIVSHFVPSSIKFCLEGTSRKLDKLGATTCFFMRRGLSRNQSRLTLIDNEFRRVSPNMALNAKTNSRRGTDVIFNRSTRLFHPSKEISVYFSS